MSDARFLIERDGQQFGPFSGRQLKELAAKNKLKQNDTIRDSETGQSKPASLVKGLLKPGVPVKAPPKQRPPEMPATAIDVSEKPEPAPHVRQDDSFESFLAKQTLEDADLAALVAYRLGTDIRDLLLMMGILTTIWTVVTFLFVYQFVEALPSGSYILFCVVSVCSLAIVNVVLYLTHRRCTSSWVIASATTLLLFVFGLIPFIVSLMLFAKVRQVRTAQARSDMDSQTWRRTKKALASIRKQPGEGWMAWRSRKQPKRADVRLRLFDDAALFLVFGRSNLVGRVCHEVVINRSAASRHPLKATKGGVALTGFAKTGVATTSTMLKKFKAIELPEDVEQAWRKWVDAGTP